MVFTELGMNRFIEQIYHEENFISSTEIKLVLIGTWNSDQINKFIDV